MSLERKLGPLFLIPLVCSFVTSCERNSFSQDHSSHDAAPTPSASQAAGSIPCDSVSAAPGRVIIDIPQGATGRGAQAFGTNPLVITTGTSVIWRNNDTVDHELHTEDDSINTGVLKPGQCYSYTFTTAGTFPYHCHIHGEDTESGTVQVNPL